MRVSYISLAMFAIGAIAAPAAPAAPKPSNSDFGDTDTGFPFTPIGSSAEDIEDGFGNSFSSALEAMKKSAQLAAPSLTSVSQNSLQTPKPTSAHVASEAPVASTPTSTSASAAAAASTTATPTPSESASASSSSTAAPAPTAHKAAAPLADLVKGLPIIGGLVAAPMAGLGLHR